MLLTGLREGCIISVSGGNISMTVIGTLRFFLTTAGMSDIIILIRFSVLFVFVLIWKK